MRPSGVRPAQGLPRRLLRLLVGCALRAPACRRGAPRAHRRRPQGLTWHLRLAAHHAGAARHRPARGPQAHRPPHGAARPRRTCPATHEAHTIADPLASGSGHGPPAAQLRPRSPRDRHPLVRRHLLRAHLGGLGLPGHGDRPLEPPRGRSGDGRPPARLAGGRGTRHGAHATSPGAGARLPLR